MKQTSTLKVGKHSTWRFTGIVGIAILMCTIVIIPTIIVMIPTKNSPDTASDITEMPSSDKTKNSQIELPQFEVSIKRSQTGEIEKVPLEKYVISVVASEMPAEFEAEALKAQAIAARTYIVNHLLHQDGEEDVIISDTTEHQVYKNEDELKTAWGSDFHWKIEKVTDAVLATEGEIITYDEQPITPTFFSMSNGFTEDAKNYWGNELPYLKSVESKWEEKHPNFTEQNVFTIDEINSKLGISLQAGNAIPIQIKRTESNRVSELVINDSTFTGKDIREKLNLRSNDFSIQQKNEHLIFTTKGYGHGVGMSQYGANGMAEEGKTYKEILSYYYQDIDINTITEAAPTLVAK
ncbi:stage II sporulation protein D [Pseudogracilibacillus auburnensis]|uniref:Stage II sporulation protein D n=1 Tax=Pseudogracilibacillus auburnensis TaxID=1494959 RepID=A0A2V3VNJ7_9BACI|nr:stage II sporulation protein D [Pseudogracilibacillus auburnensis]PXW82388.1 stage II sporulation protein D [Pseudogracilibacillus auburnensis]